MAKTTFLDGYTLFYEEIPLVVNKIIEHSEVAQAAIAREFWKWMEKRK